MPNHKVYKNVYLEKIRSVVQKIIMSYANLIVLIHIILNYKTPALLV